MTSVNPTHGAGSAMSRYPSAVQKAALAMGAVFLLVGILGFIPGVTTHYDQLTFAGHHSEAALLGIFNVSILHNIVHLAFGVAGIALARSFNAARSYLIGGGVIYLALFVYGLVIDHEFHELRPGQRCRQLAAPRLGGRHAGRGAAAGPHPPRDSRAHRCGRERSTGRPSRRTTR